MARKDNANPSRASAKDAKPAAKRAAAKKPRAQSKERKGAEAYPDRVSREHMIRERAYYLAEKRGFEPGYEESDWLAAEQEIDSQTAHS